VSGDRTLFYFSENAPQFVADIVDVGFDDLPELARKIQGLREEIDTVEAKARAIADEQAEHMNEPYDSGWVADFNAGQQQ
jgi:hypothetical protein